MLAQLRAAIVSLLCLTAITGVAYPLLVTAVGQLLFHDQANGVGTRLIGQSFTEPKYFWGRISATADSNGKPLEYNGAASSGSNLGPASSALVDEVKARVDALKAADPENTANIPVDLVTSSASGLDPDISPAAAEYQVHRVAKARSLDAAKVRALVASHTAGRTFGFLGEPRVNVLELNLALDSMK